MKTTGGSPPQAAASALASARRDDGDLGDLAGGDASTSFLVGCLRFHLKLTVFRCFLFLKVFHYKKTKSF